MINSIITITEQSINNETVQAVNARELHEFLEVGKDFTNWIKNRIEQYNFIENQDYILTFAKMQARRYFIDCEKKLKEIAQPKLPTNYLEALQALLEAETEKQALEQQAKQAIETKAWIGSKREATAMATASVATRKANKLERQLDQSKEYATVKRMQLLYHGQKFNWRDLKSTSNEMGLAPIDVFDNNYGTVKAYHKDVWLETYALEIQD